VRILHLTTHLNSGGITTYIRRLVIPLRERGIETFVASSGGDASVLFHELGVETHNTIIKTKSELDPRLYFAIPSLISLIRKKKIDILHAHTRVTQVLAYWIHKMTGIQVVTTCHGYFRRRLGRRLLPAWGNKVIAISKPVEEMLIRDFELSTKHVRTIYNGIDLEGLDRDYASHDPQKSKESYGFTPDDFVIGSMSRLVKDKGHDYLIRAMGLLKDDYPKMKVLIVGDGKYRPALEQLVKKLDLNECVVFTGMVQDIARPLAAMDCFVFPATYKEGFGLSLTEALACRKPVIATRIWAIDQILEHEKTCLLIEPKSVEGIIAGIRRLLRDFQIRTKLKNQGRLLVEKRFSIERMADQLDQVYQRRMIVSKS